MPSPAEQFIALTQTQGRVDPTLIDAVYNKLGPVKPGLMLGEWGGGILDTGHPIGDTLKEIRWLGKNFTSVEQVDPVIIDKNGQRVSWGKWGHATLREVLYRDVVSTAMIYDDRPVFDYFRYVNDDMVAGIMEGKELGESLFYFYLKR
ncbi:hypothetical protein VE01_00910 [Pseudogymnoascus verrucosus]|uniref:DUF4334 domain-containing protein n=1 Tax=Pseudogymnoascus verrucosus TaxID=342668 RepID=A0A2P2SW39_9PEZI|nr:uncharacterized protein VE01_00910 [Pseudogymnoascus verrucosus]OBU01044.1 hypothetical protein VE01_00910 [Pseudogymnoascus verrucosus]